MRWDDTVRATTDDYSRYSGLQEFTLVGGKTDLIHILVGQHNGWGEEGRGGTVLPSFMACRRNCFLGI